jgi:hypothetical protein
MMGVDYGNSTSNKPLSRVGPHLQNVGY